LAHCRQCCSQILRLPFSQIEAVGRLSLCPTDILRRRFAHSSHFSFFFHTHGPYSWSFLRVSSRDSSGYDEDPRESSRRIFSRKTSCVLVTWKYLSTVLIFDTSEVVLHHSCLSICVPRRSSCRVFSILMIASSRRMSFFHAPTPT